MGGIISRLWRKPTTIEQLEKIDKEITSVEEYKASTQAWERRLVAYILMSSFILYVMSSIVLYFWYLPPDLWGRVFYAIPWMAFPFLVYLLKRVTEWYYNHKLSRQMDRLTELQTEKRKLIEEVMDKETYKKAKEILEKYAPQQLRKAAGLGPISQPRPTPAHSPGTFSLLQRRPMPVMQNQQQPRPTQMGEETPRTRAITGIGPTLQALRRPPPSTPVRAPPPALMQPVGGWPPPRPALLPPQPTTTQSERLPFPLPRQDRSWFEKVIEYIAGDGPSQKFAVICRYCNSHNGMATLDEFEYLAFSCAYCRQVNPARKQRPVAPRLPTREEYEERLRREGKKPPLAQVEKKESEEESGSSSEEETSREKVSAEGETKEKVDATHPESIPAGHSEGVSKEAEPGEGLSPAVSEAVDSAMSDEGKPKSSGPAEGVSGPSSSEGLGDSSERSRRSRTPSPDDPRQRRSRTPSPTLQDVALRRASIEIALSSQSPQGSSSAANHKLSTLVSVDREATPPSSEDKEKTPPPAKDDESS